MGTFFKSSDEFWGWIRADGEFHSCGACGHYMAMYEDMRTGRLDYSPAYNAGWVRISSYTVASAQSLYMEVYGTEDVLQELESKIIDLAYVKECLTTNWYTVDKHGITIKEHVAR